MNGTLLEWLQSVNVQDPEVICEELNKLEVQTVCQLLRSSDKILDSVKTSMTRLSAKRFDKALNDDDSAIDDPLLSAEQNASLSELKNQVEFESTCIESLNSNILKFNVNKNTTKPLRRRLESMKARLTIAKDKHQERASRLQRLITLKVCERNSTESQLTPPVISVKTGKPKKGTRLTVFFDEESLAQSVSPISLESVVEEEPQDDVSESIQHKRQQERIRLDALQSQTGPIHNDRNRWECRQCGHHNDNHMYHCLSCYAQKHMAWYDLPSSFAYQRTSRKDHHYNQQTSLSTQSPRKLSPSTATLVWTCRHCNTQFREHEYKCPKCHAKNTFTLVRTSPPPPPAKEVPTPPAPPLPPPPPPITLGEMIVNNFKDLASSLVLDKLAASAGTVIATDEQTTVQPQPVVQAKEAKTSKYDYVNYLSLREDSPLPPPPPLHRMPPVSSVSYDIITNEPPKSYADVLLNASPPPIRPSAPETSGFAPATRSQLTRSTITENAHTEGEAEAYRLSTQFSFLRDYCLSPKYQNIELKGLASSANRGGVLKQNNSGTVGSKPEWRF